MTTNPSLLNRLQSADGPDRELEVALYMKLDPKAAWPEGMDAEHIWNWLSYFKTQWINTTSSLDAALALVREIKPNTAVHIITDGKRSGAGLMVSIFAETRMSEHKSPAIALLIALLRATSQEAGDG